jgi:adenosylcobinamide-GDP ribazoletransferase
LPGLKGKTALPTSDGQNEARNTARTQTLNGWWRDLRVCLMFLSRLPVRPHEDTPASLALSARAFGLAGAVLGGICALVLAIATAIGLNATLASLATIAAAILLTGALHEDGLADVADGFGGGATKERKLEIMRDSRIGAFGVLALVLTVAARIFALADIMAAASLTAAAMQVVAMAILSRAAMAVMMHQLPNARTDGRSSEAGRPDSYTIRQLAISSLVLALALLWLATGFWPMITVLICCCIAFAAMKRLSHNQIGGQTGDILGATQQVVEVVSLLTLAAILN